MFLSFEQVKNNNDFLMIQMKFLSIRTFYFLSFEESKIIPNIGEKIGENRVNRFVVWSDEHITIFYFRGLWFMP